MPDLKAFLSPNAVAVIGATYNPDMLRGRIMNVMMGHNSEAKVYPISRSSGKDFWAQGLPEDQQRARTYRLGDPH
ncbi:MAG: hypothetical protein VX085_17325 [Pseudomonadota bacterium]|nr:hypothetical protein [Pseudomonadota bacterium]